MSTKGVSKQGCGCYFESVTLFYPKPSDKHFSEQGFEESMSGADSNKKAAVYFSTEKSSFLQTLTGGSLLLVFLSTWFSSLGSPVFVVIWVMNGQYFPLAIILVLSAMAYLPWEKGMISNLISAYARTNVLWYKKCSYLFETKEAIPTMDKDQKPILYAFHPHGAFCMGWSVLFCSKIMNDAKVRLCFLPSCTARHCFVCGADWSGALVVHQSRP